MQGSKGGSRHAMGVVGLSEVQNEYKMSTWCVLASASSVGQMGRVECSRRILCPRESASQELYYNPGGQGLGQHDTCLGKSMNL